MFLFRFLVVLFFAPLSLFAQCCGGKPDIGACVSQVRDFDPLREYVNSKRSICGVEKLDNLTISCDIRTAWAHITEKFRCAQLRGSNGVEFDEPNCTGSTVKFHRPMDAFEVTFNLYLDYVYERAWAVSWISFRNQAGLQGAFPCCSIDPEACRGSGTCEGICLRKAYLGYNLISNGCVRLDIEIGRRPLWTVFDSYVQFANRFDGILLFASYNVCNRWDAYIKGGPFIIDERVHHYGYVAEAGLLDIFNTRFDLKYSIIDWRKHGINRCNFNNPIGADYLNSQVTLDYWLNTDFLWAKTKLYAAGIVNHEGNKRRILLDKKGNPIDTKIFPKGIIPGGHNWAWYAGFLIGQICHQGDWSLDVNFQWVEARAIPDSDLSGIGNGGLAECFCFDPDLNVSPLCPTDLTFLNRGNYKGWHIEALYAITDNFIMDMMIDFSSAINTKLIDGKHNHSRFLVQAIYAF